MSMQIKVYDKALTFLGLIEDYESASAQRSYYESGLFTITINRNIPNATIVSKKCIIQFGDDTRGFFVTKINNSIDEDGKGSQYLNISGYDLKYIFAQRVIKYLNSADAYYLSAPAETVIKTLISNQCGSTCTDSKRIFSMLQIATDQGRGPTYTLSAKYTSVYEEVATCATQSLIGWEVRIDPTNKKLILEFYEGVDRTESCLFSPDMDSLRSAEFEDSVESFKNLVYVGGDGTGASRTIHTAYDTTEPTDIDRFEMFDDASSVSTTAALTAEGVSVLSQYAQSYTLTGEVLVKCPYVFKTNYNEGDICTVEFNGISSAVRILDVEEYWGHAEYTLTVTWGKPIATISSQVSGLSTAAASSSGTSESGTNTSGMKSGVLSFDLTSANATMAANQCIYNILELTGTMSANRTVTLYLDTTTLYGRKAYAVNVSASGGYLITVTTGISGKSSITFVANGENRIEHIMVDGTGNVLVENLKEASLTSGVLSFDLTSANATMAANQCIYNILELTGTMSANRTVTLYLDTTTLYGRKIYSVKISATGGKIITLTTGILSKVSVTTIAESVPYIIHVMVDDTGNVTRNVTDETQPELPSMRLNVFNYSGLLEYLRRIHRKNKNIEVGSVVAYTHGATAVADAYVGGVYSPTQNRIYFVPWAQANQSVWHYLDCATGSVVAYTHGATAVADAYNGGVYSPTQNRIYFVPTAQANQSVWHYLDCATGSVVAYTHGATAVVSAYGGGVYSPTQNRIYFVPWAQANQSIWHYILELSSAEISPSLMASTLFNKL